MFSNIFAQFPGTAPTANATKVPQPQVETDSDAIYEDFPTTRPANRSNVEILKPVEEESDQRRPWRSRISSSVDHFDAKMKRRASVESAAASSINSGCLLEHDLYSKKRKQQVTRGARPGWEMDHHDPSVDNNKMGSQALDMYQGLSRNSKLEDEIEMARKALDEANHLDGSVRSHSQRDHHHRHHQHNRRHESRRQRDRFDHSNHESLRSSSESDHHMDSLSRHDRRQKSQHRHGGHSPKPSSRHNNPYNTSSRPLKSLSQQRGGEPPTELTGMVRRRSWGSESSSDMKPLQNEAMSPGQKTNSSLGDNHSFDDDSEPANAMCGRSDSPVSFAPTESTTDGPTNTTTTSDVDDQKSVEMAALTSAPLQVSTRLASSFESLDDDGSADGLLVDFPSKESGSADELARESVISTNPSGQSDCSRETSREPVCIDARSPSVYIVLDEVRQREELEIRGTSQDELKGQEHLGRAPPFKKKLVRERFDFMDDKRVESEFEGSDCSTAPPNLDLSKGASLENIKMYTSKDFPMEDFDGSATVDEILMDRGAESADGVHHPQHVDLDDFIPLCGDQHIDGVVRRSRLDTLETLPHEDFDDVEGETDAFSADPNDVPTFGSLLTDHVAAATLWSEERLDDRDAQNVVLVPLKENDAFNDLPMEDFNGQESFMESMVIENDDFDYFQQSVSSEEEQRESKTKITDDFRDDGSVKSLLQSQTRTEEFVSFGRDVSTTKLTLSQRILMSGQSTKSVGQRSVHSGSVKSVEERQREDASQAGSQSYDHLQNHEGFAAAIQAGNGSDVEVKRSQDEIKEHDNDGGMGRSRHRSKSHEGRSQYRSRSHGEHESKKRHRRKSAHRSERDKNKASSNHRHHDKELHEGRPRKERARSESKDHRTHREDRHKSRDRHRSRDGHRSGDGHRERRKSRERPRNKGEIRRHKSINDERRREKRDHEGRRHRSQDRGKGHNPSTRSPEEGAKEKHKRRHHDPREDRVSRRKKDSHDIADGLQVVDEENAVTEQLSQSHARPSNNRYGPRNKAQRQNNRDDRLGRLQTGPGMGVISQKSVSGRLGRKSLSILAYSWTSEQTITGNPLYRMEDDSAVSRVRRVGPIVSNDIEQRPRKGLLGKLAKATTWFQRLVKRKGEDTT